MNNKTISKYQSGKEKAREKALKLFDEYLILSWYELALKTDELNRLAKRFGLIKEFKENGII